MSEYRRVYQPGGCSFFTVVTFDRRPILTELQGIARLRAAFRQVKERRPFDLDAIVVLPHHLHCIWRLPEGDEDYSTRWRLIKRYFAIGVDAQSNDRQEKAVWQRPYWEHAIRDEDDWRRHMDYIHYNPVKHGYVSAAGDWRYSSFRRAVTEGMYDAAWGTVEPATIEGFECE